MSNKEPSQANVYNLELISSFLFIFVLFFMLFSFCYKKKDMIIV